jgi:translation initiation factor 2 beta subunit (eIF-2beta)/eIF-5
MGIEGFPTSKFEKIETETPSDLDLDNFSKEERIERRKMLMDRYKEDLEKILKIGKLLETDDNRRLREQEIDLDQVVFIRADNFSPNIENNQLKILNAHDATDGKIWRLTNHYTLNHRVAGNIGGDWENTKYQFVVPGEKMMEINGKPDNLYSIDSFWNKSNILPESSVIIYEKGNKPEIPEELKDTITLIERDIDVNDKELISLVLEKMNYSEIKGKEWAVSPGYENFDKGIKLLTDKKNIDTGVHAESWTEAFENVGDARFELDYEMGRISLWQIYREGREDELKRMPKELKEKSWQTLFEVFKIKEQDFPRLREERLDFYIKFLTREGIEKAIAEEIFEKEFSNEEISERINKSKEKISKFLDNLFESKISKEEKSLIFKNIPIEAWQYSINNALAGGLSSNQVKSNFDKYYAKAYQDTTGEKLNTTNLRF